jgi:UV DNA damage endonuclease
MENMHVPSSETMDTQPCVVHEHMRLSLCCQSVQLHEQGVRFRTMTVTQFKKKPRQEALMVLCQRIIENFVTLKATVELCVRMHLAGMRIGSDLIPVINHPDLNLDFYQLPMQDEMLHAIQQAKTCMQQSGLRFSAHPSEYVSLTSDNPQVIANSIRDLTAHAFIFELLELPESYKAPFNIHIRKDGDADMIHANVVRSLMQCPVSVRKRLVFENNDNRKGVWHVHNLVKYFHAREGIPITFDTLHHKMLPGHLSEQQAFLLAHATWPIMPIFHYSEGIGDSRKHADYACHAPPHHGKPVVWEVELKAKDRAIQGIMNMQS